MRSRSQTFLTNISATLSGVLLVAAQASTPSTNVGTLSQFARSQGIAVCVPALQTLEKNLFDGSEYSIRPFVAEKNPSRHALSALVDSRRFVAGEPQRSLTHVTLAPASDGKGCALMYEQTRHHMLRCESVLAQMAPLAKEQSGIALGSFTVDLHRNMTLTVLPIGTAQCVSIVKEVSYR
jgi:hypothetical protein